MQPKTSVRQPVIASARRQHLSELLRTWRRQPRKRSPLLFWSLLSLALMSDSALLFLVARLLGVWDSTFWERLSGISWLSPSTSAWPALSSSLLALVFFTMAAAVRAHWPLWRRRLLFGGLLSGFCCLAWLLFREGLPPISDSGHGMLWLACMVLGLGLFLAMIFRDAFVAFVGALSSNIGLLASSQWPLSWAESWPALPQGAADDLGRRVQVLLLLSAYAALALAWGIAAGTLVRVLVDAPAGERLRRLAALCLWPIRLAILLLAASALLDGWQVLAHGSIWHDWNAQALGTLLILPSCVALIYAQRRGQMPPFRLLYSVLLGFTFLAMMGQSAVLWQPGRLHFDFDGAVEVSTCLAGLISLSLAAHASLRYYFGKQRILEV